MRWHRYLVRLVAAVASSVVVCGLMVALFGAIAMAIEWELPEPQELLGPSTLFDRTGVAMYRFRADVERRPVPLEQISPSLRQAVVAAEDHRFYEHQGVDPFSVARAIVSNVRSGGIRQGGSTLTQQLVKNVYVGSDRSFRRKVREAVISLQLEKDRTKDEILAEYLNRVYFGDGAYGAEAAALSYFGKPAAELTVAESATLAGVLTSPSRLSPRAAPEAARARRDRVLDQMVAYGMLGESDAATARAEPVAVVPRQVQEPAAPYYVEEVRRQLVADPAIGPDRLYNGGLHITAALELQQQFALEVAVAQRLPEDPDYDAGVAVIDPATGDILAAYSGRDFARSQVDTATGAGFASGGRPSGSTFKPFVLAAALEDGTSLSTTYPGPSSIRIADWRPGGAACGRCTLEEAMVRSINTVYAQLGRDVGVPAFVGVARRMGVRSPLSDMELTQALGTSSVTPIDLSSAFGTLANDGVACPARHITEVTAADGSPLPAPDPRAPTPEEREAWAGHLTELGYDFSDEDHGRCYRAIAPSVARSVTQALEGAVARGTGTNANIGRPQAGKTGTSNDSKEIWFAGYTPHRSIAVSFFYLPEPIPLRGLPGCSGACYGGTIPALIWRDVAEVLLADVPPDPFPPPVSDERAVPDRRRLGPPATPPPPPPAPAPAPTAPHEPDPSPVEPTAPPAKPPPPSEPPPPAKPAEEPPDEGGGGGILPPILPGD